MKRDSGWKYLRPTGVRYSDGSRWKPKASRDATGRETQSSARIKEREREDIWTILRKVVVVCEKSTFMEKFALKYFCHRDVSFLFLVDRNCQKNNSTQFPFNFLQYLTSLLVHSMYILSGEKETAHRFSRSRWYSPRMSLLLLHVISISGLARRNVGLYFYFSTLPSVSSRFTSLLWILSQRIVGSIL